MMLGVLEFGAGLVVVLGLLDVVARANGVRRDQRLVGALGLAGGLCSLAPSLSRDVDGVSVLESAPNGVLLGIALFGVACTFASAGLWHLRLE